MENCYLKNNNLCDCITLANCFVNMRHLKSKYSEKLEEKVNLYCPDMFKDSIFIPEFYKKTIEKYKI